jgi:hypothetical protein
MTPHDIERFRETIAGFVADVEPPLFLIATDQHGSIIVTSHRANAVAEQIIKRVSAPGLVSPITVVAISVTGSVKWAKVTIETQGATLQ